MDTRVGEPAAASAVAQAKRDRLIARIRAIGAMRDLRDDDGRPPADDAFGRNPSAEAIFKRFGIASPISFARGLVVPLHLGWAKIVLAAT